MVAARQRKLPANQHEKMANISTHWHENVKFDLFVLLRHHQTNWLSRKSCEVRPIVVVIVVDVVIVLIFIFIWDVRAQEHP